MLWILGVVVCIVAIWLLTQWIAFSAFKSELMSALGRKGFDYEAADTLYAINAKLINGLHGGGLTAQQIVDQLFPEGQRTSDAPPPHGNKARSDNLPTSSDDQYSRIGRFVERALNVQSVRVRNTNGEIFSHAIDDWLAGYVHGTFDAALQREGIALDTPALDEFKRVLIRAFGETVGQELSERHLACSLMPDDLFLDGVRAGGQDLYNFLGVNKAPPMSWANRVHQSVEPNPSA